MYLNLCLTYSRIILCAFLYFVFRFEESFADFQRAFRELRGNQLIDYNPLGLRYKLYACEVRALQECEESQCYKCKAMDYDKV